MNINTITALVLITAITVFVYKNRKKVKIQKILFPFLYIVMFKSNKGLNKMDKIARKHPQTTKFLGYTGIIIGFIGMILIGAELILNTINLFLKPETTAGIQPVLPLEAKGVFFVPFIYWIITIFIVALVHEFAHGIIARTHKIPLKSTGIAFVCILIPILPAAFVEPDEETLRQRNKKEQLSVLAAGSFSNIITAAITLILIISTAPLLGAAFQEQGIKITEITKDSPASKAGIQQNENIMFLGNKRVNTTKEFMQKLTQLKPGQEIKLKTEENAYKIKLGAHPKNKSKAYIGIKLEQQIKPKKEFVKKYGSLTPNIIKSSYSLISWIFLLNLGIGLFNLLPIIPLDGGRMLKTVLKDKKHGIKLFKYISTLFLILIIINLAAGFLK